MVKICGAILANKSGYIPKTSNFSTSAYAGKCRHFPENSNMVNVIRFESEALGATDNPFQRDSNESVAYRSILLQRAS